MSDLPEAGWLLAIDTATATIVVAAGRPDGRLLASKAFEGRYRHSQELLPAIVALIAEAGLRLADLVAVVVGTGPGAFTGLRVGLATAKTLAHELRVPVVGIASSDALLAAAPSGTVLWLPSGPRDRLSMTAGNAAALVPGTGSVMGPEPEAGALDAVAVDLDGRAPASALALGRAAVEALPANLVRLGSARLAAGEVDDPERLLPRYASAPRGAAEGQADGSVAWSRDPR